LCNAIIFGSDGYRGRLAQSATFEAFSRIIVALFRYLSEQREDPHIVIGYDRRFMSDIFAHNLARFWEKLGGSAVVISHPTTSPLLAWFTHRAEASMGVMITASHNPPDYAGIKLKESFGGSARPNVQAEISRIASDTSAPDFFLEPTYMHHDIASPLDDYYEALIAAFAEADLSRRNSDVYKPHISRTLVVDYMHGAAAEVVPAFLSRLGFAVHNLREDRDPTFGGVSPEPLPSKLGDLVDAVREYNGDALGFAFDGDGDRLTVVDESGEFVENHELFSIYLRHLAKNRRLQGRAVGTVSFSAMIDRVADDLSIPLKRVPVGFKAVSEEFLKGDVMIGGEESGGTGFGFWLPERDALVMVLFLLEALDCEGKSLVDLRRELDAHYGPLRFGRADLKLASTISYDELDRVLPGVGDPVAAMNIHKIDRQDGRKLVLSGDSWILFRLSGTEPAVRLYAESPKKSLTDTLLHDAGEMISSLLMHR